MKLRGNILQRIAAQAAADPWVKQIIMESAQEAATIAASSAAARIQAGMPKLFERYAAAEAARQGSHVLRVYPRTKEREDRDARVLAGIAAGLSPTEIAADAGCSVRHVYYVRRAKSAP